MIIIKLETRELSTDESKSSYNHTFYKLKNKVFGCSYLHEKYNEAGNYSDYQIGDFVKDEFFYKIQGDGQPVQSVYQNYGGVYLEIEVDESYLITKL